MNKHWNTIWRKSKVGYRPRDFSCDTSKFLWLCDPRNMKGTPKEWLIGIPVDFRGWKHRFGKQKEMASFFHPSIIPCYK